ncbi:hypothetical protein H8E88_01095 [candidate division KSB1 bacterium]|nr:hypothetical protein [candidate division KSB1 bacterium]
MSVSKTKSEILPEATQRLKNLSLDRLLVANDFLSYLEDRESSVATQELLNIPGFMDAFYSASQQAEQDEVTKFDNIRRDV